MPIVSMIYYKNTIPFKINYRNYIEIVNDCFLLYTGLAVIIFSDITLDVQFRYNFGFFYMYSIIIIISINFTLIILA